MYRRTLSVLATLFVLIPCAQASEALAQQAGCAVCHAAAEKRIGPSWQDIAARYKGDAAAPALLVTRVREGTKGNWGEMPMMATPPERASDEQVQALVDWVLTH